MTGRVLPRSARLPLVYSFTPAWGPACPCVERVRASKTYVMCADPAGCYFRRFAADVLSLSRSEGPRFAAPVASPAPLRWICRSNSFSVEARPSNWSRGPALCFPGKRTLFTRLSTFFCPRSNTSSIFFWTLQRLSATVKCPELKGGWMRTGKNSIFTSESAFRNFAH